MKQKLTEYRKGRLGACLGELIEFGELFECSFASFETYLVPIAERENFETTVIENRVK